MTARVENIVDPWRRLAGGVQEAGGDQAIEVERSAWANRVTTLIRRCKTRDVSTTNV